MLSFDRLDVKPPTTGFTEQNFAGDIFFETKDGSTEKSGLTDEYASFTDFYQGGGTCDSLSRFQLSLSEVGKVFNYLFVLDNYRERCLAIPEIARSTCCRSDEGKTDLSRT